LDEQKLATLIARHGIRDLLHKSILLVEDEEPNLTVLRSVLEDAYTVHEARSGAEALAIALREPLDVVVTDQRMPGMTGIDMLERLRAFRPDVAGIVLTGYTDTPALMSAINQARVFRYLKKPWTIEELLDTVALASRYVHQQRAVVRLAEELSGKNQELAQALDDLEAAQGQMLHMERVAAVGRLAAGILHDLRNLSTGLMFLDQDLVEQGVAEETVEAVRVQLGGIRHLMNTLETMHQFVRNNRLAVAPSPISATRIVDDALAVTKLDPEFRERAVTTDVDRALPVIEVDRQKIVQVLVNLIRNAVQSTIAGEGIRVEAGMRDGDVVFAVEDDGPGVAPEVRANLFQPFVSTKGEEGVGMGLYMSRMVVESHGGRLVFVPQSAGGARFEVILPV
jgi:signal transduction histidine kinase